MRVVHVAPTPFSVAGVLGGGERYPLELARAMAGKVESRLLTFGRCAGRWREPGGLEILVLPARGFLGGHPAHPLSPEIPYAVRDADVIHVHQMGALPSRVAALVGRALGKRVVVTDHGLPGARWGGVALRLFHAFLTVSQCSARFLGAPGDRTRVIYGGADTERFHPGGEPRRGVLFVGRITPHKGIDRLIEALPAGAPLTVAGSEGHDPREPERSYSAYVRTLAQGKQVTFATPVEDAVLPALYRRAQVLVLPSVEWTVYGQRVRISELLGLALLEAMASGTPVICSRIGGLVEVIEDGRTGFLVEPGDVAGLRERLLTLLNQGAMTERMGLAGRERVVERFTWKACAQRSLDAYDELR